MSRDAQVAEAVITGGAEVAGRATVKALDATAEVTAAVITSPVGKKVMKKMAREMVMPGSGAAECVVDLYDVATAARGP